MFGSAAKIPDLDFRGETATLEAEALFWSVLEDHLDKALSGRTPPASWRKEALPTGETAILLYGLQVDEARGLWSSALRGMSATERGPGLEVADPLFESGNYMDQEGRKAVIITRLIFWPEDHLRTRDGEAVPPVRFRSQTSPGYLDLLDRQGPRPYFADGWLWLPRGEEREGWRIAGLPRLLFPEGRKALERLARRAKEEQEAELNRLLRNPSLFKDQDAKVVRELRSAIGQAEARIKELSLFDTRDLILCIFEAWYRQRDAWSRETVRLEDGTEVSTKPYRVIRLDPEDFRVRLDPRAATGANWRSHLFRRLEALATFERQTRDRKGRKLDVGDRLIERVLDGFQGVEEGSAPDQDSGLGLTRLLRKAGAVPSRDFFVTVSLDFMQRLVTWAVDEKGAIHWGLEAAKAAERAALAKAPETPKEARRGAEEVRRAAKAKPYFDGSPRLMSLSNLEDWPQADKDLAHALLQEVTRRGGKRRLSDGRDLIACAGSHGKGYKVQAWISKWAPHLLRSGPRGGVKAFALFTQSLRSLCLHGTLSVQVELRLSRRREETSPGESKWNEDALALLESYRDNPRAVYGLKLIPYLPEDLEDRLRKRLLEDGIEAVDEAEAGASVFAPPAKGVLAPADIRGARKRAGWGQAELAAKVGVSRVAISCWESGKKSIPKGRMGRLREVLAQYLEAEARGSWA
jgi:DNA-binding transcriptional regulator YiaG